MQQSQHQYKCPSCGLNYKSSPALYTHIKNKHPDQRQQIYKQIEKPKRAQKNQTQFRTSDINYDPKDIHLRTQAEGVAMRINCNRKEVGIQILKGQLQFDSDDSELLIELQIAPLQAESKRRKMINNSVKQLAETYEVAELLEATKTDKEIQSFKQGKSELNILRQVSKIFTISFAAKVQFSLRLIHASAHKHQEIGTTLQELWIQTPNNVDQLRNYYKEWNRVRFDQGWTETKKRTTKAD